MQPGGGVTGAEVDDDIEVRVWCSQAMVRREAVE
jgi:hypothetical protein